MMKEKLAKPLCLAATAIFFLLYFAPVFYPASEMQFNWYIVFFSFALVLWGIGAISTAISLMRKTQPWSAIVWPLIPLCTVLILGSSAYLVTQLFLNDGAL